MKNWNIPDDKKNALLGMAAGKLGRDPESLMQDLQSGNLDAITSNLDPKTASQVNSLLSNPKALEALLTNDQLIKLLGGLGKK